MKRRLCGAGRFLPFVLTSLGLTVVLVLASLALAACGGGTPTRETTLDTGATTTSSTPPSLPATSSGITLEQVQQLVATYSGYPIGDVKVTDYKTFGDWAGAKITDQQGIFGYVFQKQNAAWVIRGVVDSSYLSYLGAPAEVRKYFGF